MQIDSFFSWFYYWGGLGGWLLFFVFAIATVAWLFYDSFTRRLPVLGLQIVSVFSAALILPAALYRFTVREGEISLLSPYSEPIFYFGVLAWVVPLFIDIGYYIYFQGKIGCQDGHVYESALGKCPHPDHHKIVKIIETSRRKLDSPEKPKISAIPQAPLRQKSHALLISKDGKNYPIFKGKTTIGRAPENDITLGAHDKTVSRFSVKIVEQNDSYRLYVIDSDKPYPRMKGQHVRTSILLEHDDEIEFGEKTVFRFMTSR